MLRKLSLLLGLWMLSACAVRAGAGEPAPNARETHVLNRLAFGPSQGDLDRIRSLGVDGYIQEQLSPASIPLPRSLAEELESLGTLRLSAPQLFLEYGPPAYRGAAKDKQAIRQGRQRARVIVEEAVQARMARALQSPRQLEEVMVNFWFNHFNVFAQKGLDHLWVGSYEKEAIRPYALGRFRDLLGATAKHPAMLFYLDNWQNTAPDSPGARGNFKGLNENYARELMELHTLGVDGGYTQADVVALARILTGWGFRRPGQAVQARAARLVGAGSANGSGGGFYFDRTRHDFSTKVFLGLTIKGTGVDEGERALDILAEHPATARRIGYKLAQYFVSDDPPASLVERLAAKYLQTRGDIRAVLDLLFHSPEFWDEQYTGAKFKTPYEYVLSAARAAGVSVSNYRPLYGAMAQLGMPLYLCQTPDGYKNTKEAWLNPNAMTQRLNFATALAAGRLPLQQAPAAAEKTNEATRRTPEPAGGEAADPARLIAVLGGALSRETRSTVESAPRPFRAPLILGSPEFMHR